MAVRRSGKGLGWILPGILVAATGVGAGDLATAGFAGSKLGLGVAWALIFGAVLKWTLNEGLARWQMGTGTTLLEGWIRRLRLQWVFVVYLLIWSLFVGGALISATGVAGTALLPLHEDPVVSKRIWGIGHSLVAMGLVLAGGFAVFEKVMGACIGLMFVTVLYCSIRIAPEVDWTGMRFVAPWRLEGDEAGWVMGLIGGVGGTLTLLSYGYWIREKGRTGAEGVRLCRLDLAVGYTMTALFGVAMLLIASTVTGLEGKGARLVEILGHRLGGTMGPAVELVFLIGAWGAIFSSMLGVYQSVPYLFADFLSEARWIDASRRASLDHAGSGPYKAFLVYLAVPPMLALWIDFKTTQLLYAVLGAVFMPLLAGTLLILNNHRGWMRSEFRNGWLVNLFLVVTLVFFLWQGVSRLLVRLG